MRVRLGRRRHRYNRLAADLRPMGRRREKATEAGSRKPGDRGRRNRFASPCCAGLVSPTGGDLRILGELKKLGIRMVSRSTVINILREAGLDRGSQAWSRLVERLPGPPCGHAVGQRLPHGEDLDHTWDRRLVGAVLDSSRHAKGVHRRRERETRYGLHEAASSQRDATEGRDGPCRVASDHRSRREVHERVRRDLRDGECKGQASRTDRRI